jgi:hypothetical protein
MPQKISNKLPAILSTEELLRLGGEFVDSSTTDKLPAILSTEEILKLGGKFKESPQELEEIRARQAAKYPTPQEMGFPAGTSVEEALYETPTEAGKLLGRKLSPPEMMAQLKKREERLGPERMLGMAEGIGIDLQSPLFGTVSNIWEGIKTVPSLLKGPANIFRGGITANPEIAQRGREQTLETLKSLGTLLASGAQDLYGGLQGTPVEQARAQGQIAGLAGDILMGSKTARGIPREVQAVARDPRNLIAGIERRRNIAEKQRKKGAERIEKAVLSGQNASLQDKALAVKISDDLLKRKEWATTGSRLDAKIQAKTDELGKEVGRIEEKISPSATTINGRKPIIDHIDNAIEELKENKLVDTSPAVQAFIKARDRVMKLDAYPSVRDMIKQRRFLDRYVADAKGFDQTKVGQAFKADIEASRLVAHALREEIGKAVPDLNKVNKEYTLYKTASTIIERRQLGGVGGDALMASVGRITDDLVASYLGYQIGGKAGAITLGALNLQRNMPGPNSMRARLNEILAQTLDPRPLDPRVEIPTLFDPLAPDIKQFILPERAGAPYATPPPAGPLSPDFIPEGEFRPYKPYDR